jgi:hypothetical protein
MDCITRTESRSRPKANACLASRPRLNKRCNVYAAEYRRKLGRHTFFIEPKRLAALHHET